MSLVFGPACFAFRKQRYAAGPHISDVIRTEQVLRSGIKGRGGGCGRVRTGAGGEDGTGTRGQFVGAGV